MLCSAQTQAVSRALVHAVKHSDRCTRAVAVRAGPVQAISWVAGLLASSACQGDERAGYQQASIPDPMTSLLGVMTPKTGLSSSSNTPGKRSAAVGGVSGGTQDVGSRQCKHTAMYANRLTWSTRACIRLQHPCITQLQADCTLLAAAVQGSCLSCAHHACPEALTGGRCMAHKGMQAPGPAAHPRRRVPATQAGDDCI